MKRFRRVLLRPVSVELKMLKGQVAVVRMERACNVVTMRK